MIAYFLSALLTFAAIALVVWLLMLALDRLTAHFADSEWLDDNGLRLIVTPDACAACWAVGYHHAGCRPTVWHDQTEHCDWFPQAYTGPGPVPAPVQPVHLVYDEHGYSVLTYVAPTDGGMYGAPKPDENGPSGVAT